MSRFPPNLRVANFAGTVTPAAGVDQEVTLVTAAAAGRRRRIWAVGIVAHEANIAAGARLRSVTVPGPGGLVEVTNHAIVVDQYPESWRAISGGFALPAATTLVMRSRSSIVNFEARVTVHYTDEPA